MNRYEAVRASLPRSERRRLSMRFQKALARWAQNAKTEMPDFRRIVVPSPDGPIYCICTVEYLPGDGLPPEEHISVSHGLGASLPSWDSLVLVRSLAWPDDARVVQELPPLIGPKANPWINVEGVEVLHLHRYRDTP